MAADTPSVQAVFERMFRGGLIRSMPKIKADADVFLALAASTFDPRRSYTEQEVNEHLEEWLTDFVDLVMLDHVTVRRYLADNHLLIRDPAGSTYKANQVVIGTIISPEARSVQPGQILSAYLEEKRQRHEAHQHRSRKG